MKPCITFVYTRTPRNEGIPQDILEAIDQMVARAVAHDFEVLISGPGLVADTISRAVRRHGGHSTAFSYAFHREEHLRSFDASVDPLDWPDVLLFLGSTEADTIATVMKSANIVVFLSLSKVLFELAAAAAGGKIIGILGDEDPAYQILIATAVEGQTIVSSTDPGPLLDHCVKAYQEFWYPDAATLEIPGDISDYLVWDAEYTWWQGDIRIREGQNISLTVSAGSDVDLDDEHLSRVVQSVLQLETRYKEQAAREYTELYNANWKEAVIEDDGTMGVREDAPDISESDFIGNLTTTALHILADGSFELELHPGDLFLGHVLTIDIGADLLATSFHLQG